jgi:hypothetical protein
MYSIDRLHSRLAWGTSLTRPHAPCNLQRRRTGCLFVIGGLVWRTIDRHHGMSAPVKQQAALEEGEGHRLYCGGPQKGISHPPCHDIRGFVTLCVAHGTPSAPLPAPPPSHPPLPPRVSRARRGCPTPGHRALSAAGPLPRRRYYRHPPPPTPRAPLPGHGGCEGACEVSLPQDCGC